mmetsp:Transcript_26715/g.63715  ORF Transcript_26715/g.63715 Transcript_26715/m.63715 type:complete len:89 (+) Transcript_26715:155-421(+)
MASSRFVVFHPPSSSVSAVSTFVVDLAATAVVAFDFVIFVLLPLVVRAVRHVKRYTGCPDDHSHRIDVVGVGNVWVVRQVLDNVSSLR